jgi:hypothetical protein
LIEALPHGLKIFYREGLETNIQSDAPTPGKPFKKFLVKGDRDRGMPPPEEIVIFKERKELKTELFVSRDIRVDDIEKPPVEKIGKIFAEERKDLFRNEGHHGPFRKKSFQLPINVADGTIAVSKSKKP